MASNGITIVIFDVGKNSIDYQYKNGATFLDREKECLRKIMQRLIFTKPRDELSLILMGTKDTNNKLNDENGTFKNIKIGFSVSPIKWEMLQYVDSELDQLNNEATADWLDALIVAMDELKRLDLEKNDLKIILMTTFTTKIDERNWEIVANGIRGLHIELTVITHNIEYESDCIDSAVFSQSIVRDECFLKSEKAIKRILDQCDGILCSFEEALPQLMHIDQRARNRRAANYDFLFGTLLKIKVSSYIYLQAEKSKLPPWKRASKYEQTDDETTSDITNASSNPVISKLEIGNSVFTKTELFLDDQKLNADAVVDNIVKGYMYGDEAVSFEYAKKFESGGRQLRLIGFSKEERISDYFLLMEKIHVVVAQKGFQVAQKMLAALTRAMRKNNLVMIARYVYNAITEPKLMVLFPNNHHRKYPEHNSLLMTELIFRENIREKKFPSLRREKIEPTKEQYEVMGKLIDCMDLMNANDADVFASNEENEGSKEAFKKLLNPVIQHTYRAVTQRALHPKEPVLAVDKDLKEMLDVPSKLQTDVDSISAEMKKLCVFKDNKEEFKKSVLRRMDNVVQRDQDVITKQIGTITPAEDFAELLNAGERFENLAKQLNTVIEDIIFKYDLPDKVPMAICAFREAAKSRSPYVYNEWITIFKEQLINRDRIAFWQNVIVKEKLGLLSTGDAEQSTVTNKEAEEFYELPKEAEQIENNDDQGDANIFEDMFE